MGQEGLWFKKRPENENGRVLEVTIDAKETKMSEGRTKTNNANHETRICRRFQTNGNCGYGSSCRYAHGVPGIRNPMQAQVLLAGKDSREENKQVGRNFQNRGKCEDGDKWQFVHAGNGLFVDVKRGMISSENHRLYDNRNPCFHWRDRGFCGFGDRCRFAHARKADDQCRVNTSSEFKFGEGAITAPKAYQTAKGAVSAGVRRAYQTVQCAASAGVRRAYQTVQGASSAGVRRGYQTLQGTLSTGIREAYHDSQKSGGSKSPILLKKNKISGVYADWIDDQPPA